MEEFSETVQMQARLAYLTTQIEHMQWELARLSRESQIGNAGITAMRKHLLNSDAQMLMQKELADILVQLESHQEGLEELTKSIKKQGRTQFKANTLSESKEQQLAVTISLLQEIVTKREDVKTEQQQEERARQEQLQTQTRADVAAAFLPVLDGIEMALEHDISLPAPVQESQESISQSPQPSGGFLHKLFHPGAKPPVLDYQPRQPQESLQGIYAAMQSWRHGLSIVRDRFLSLLAKEGIERIPDVNTLFDPHLHIAIDTEERTDVVNHTIVAVIRTGYMHNDRVLRYAEVIVAKSPLPEKTTIEETQEEHNERE